MSGASLVGRTVGGRFTVTETIGTGGFASVHRGTQVGEPREVALKIMDPRHAGNRNILRRFRREAEAAASLDHPNIVRILDHGVDGDVAYIVMELLGGYDLFEALARDRRVAEARAARIVMQVCDALTAAHALGIVHRDLKPENIMLVGDPTDPALEQVKVLDFGIAKILDRDPPPPPAPSVDAEEGPSSSPSAISKVGMVMGTPHYVSPELGRAEPIDGRSDVYACGVLLYQLLAGQPPFDGETPLQVVMRHVHEKPRPLSTLVPRVSSRLEAVVMKALAKQPSDRQQTAAELKEDLAELLPGLAVEPLVSLRPPPPLVRTPARPVVPPSALAFGESADALGFAAAAIAAAPFPTLPIPLGTLDTPSVGLAPPRPAGEDLGRSIVGAPGAETPAAGSASGSAAPISADVARAWSSASAGAAAGRGLSSTLRSRVEGDGPSATGERRGPDAIGRDPATAPAAPDGRAPLSAALGTAATKAPIVLAALAVAVTAAVLLLR